MQFYDYFGPYDNITANSCFCSDLVGDPESELKMLEAHNLRMLLSYCEVHFAPNPHQTVWLLRSDILEPKLKFTGSVATDYAAFACHISLGCKYIELLPCPAVSKCIYKWWPKYCNWVLVFVSARVDLVRKYSLNQQTSADS